ncbi:MAG TPA: TetR/AcrR family transcriptional regulator [Sphingopyxis sp.]|uniref:TetR/AcrR family transcriptional regulator n=1 Tax=Sphingopyxis sp. TaxID=1908224 RepID=UPI002B6726A1|nr:TetR/AcrR family transcriptional regulator [Sphingopyxis sp.]HWW57959.1 TetR/AcrR family transcriptional regulator [Sphingopyxis sp.]
MGEAAGATRAYHKGNVADDLIAAARKILKTERFEDVSVRRLAREVGVTPGNFYNHFASLDQLFLDIAADAFDTRRRAQAKLIKKADNRIDALVATTLDFVEFAIREKQLFRIMFGQVPGSFTHDRFRQASDAAFAQLVEFVYREPRYVPGDRALSHARLPVGYGLFCLMYGLARNISENQIEFSDGDGGSVTQFVEDVVRSFVDGTAVAELREG